MAHRLFVLLPIVVACPLACGPRPAPGVPAPGPSIRAFCEEADADGARPPPLIDAMPPAALEWLDGWIDVPDDPAEVRLRAEAALASWNSVTATGGAAAAGGIGSMPAALLQILEAAYLSEMLLIRSGSADDPSAAVLFEPIYDALNLPAIFARGFVQQLGDLFVQLLAAGDGPVDVLRAGLDFLRFLRALPDRARALHRHAARQVVCGGDASLAAVVSALRNLADSAGGVGDRSEELAFRIEVVRLAPVEPAYRYALATTAYRALDAPLGDRAAAEADRLCGAECTERPRDLDALAGAARDLADIGDPDDAEERLRAAAAHETLGNFGRAKTLYEDAAAGLPDDARPATGLAAVVMAETLDAAVALAIIEGAGPRNRDERYHALLVATRAMILAYDVLPRLVREPDAAQALGGIAVASLQDAVERWADFEPGRARALLLLLDGMRRGLAIGAAGGEAAVRAAVGDLASKALVLHAEHPDVPDVARLLAASALFAATREEALAALAPPCPAALAADGAFLVRRAGIALATAVRWQDRELFDRAAVLWQAIPDSVPVTREVLAADLAAVAWRLGYDETTSLALVLGAYGRAALNEALPTDHRPRVLNNLGAILAETGDAGAAAERWRRSEELAGDAADVPRYNRLALAALAESPTAEALDAVRAHMTGLAGGDGNPALRRQALLWLAWLAGRQGDPGAAATLRAEADAVRGDLLNGSAATGDRGLVIRGKFSLGVGYSTIDRLVVSIDIGAWTWLVIPAPR